MLGLRDLDAAVKAYHAKNGKIPDPIDNLVLEGLMPYIPIPPKDMKFSVDKVTIEVKLVKK